MISHRQSIDNSLLSYRKNHPDWTINGRVMAKKRKPKYRIIGILRKISKFFRGISQNVTRTSEKTQIEKMVFLWYFDSFFGHKIHVLHVYRTENCREYGIWWYLSTKLIPYLSVGFFGHDSAIFVQSGWFFLATQETITYWLVLRNHDSDVFLKKTYFLTGKWAWYQRVLGPKNRSKSGSTGRTSRANRYPENMFS